MASSHQRFTGELEESDIPKDPEAAVFVVSAPVFRDRNPGTVTREPG